MINTLPLNKLMPVLSFRNNIINVNCHTNKIKTLAGWLTCNHNTGVRLINEVVSKFILHDETALIMNAYMCQHHSTEVH